MFVESSVLIRFWPILDSLALEPNEIGLDRFRIDSNSKIKNFGINSIHYSNWVRFQDLIHDIIYDIWIA